jgi:hypothetical protein
MATIRTQLVSGQRRIITKVVNGVRRVSCSCCPSEEECCMYPAAALVNGQFTSEDLPDTIVYNLSGGGNLTYNKLGAPVEAFGGLVYYKEALSGPIESGEEDVIFIQSGDGEDSGWQTIVNGAAIDGSRDCLVSSTQNTFIRDTFADTYTVSWASVDIPTTTVTRVSLCQWRSEVITIPSVNQPYVVILYYEGFIFAPPFSNTPDRLFWSIEGERKNGAQNTPVGTYTIGDSTATVSE